MGPRRQRAPQAEDVLARPPPAGLFPVVPRLRDAEDPGKPLPVLLPEDPEDLVLRPEVKLPLLALAVRVFRRVKPSGRIGHLTQDIRDHLPGGPGELLSPRREVGLRIRYDEKRLIVEHLLEVRDEPFRIR